MEGVKVASFDYIKSSKFEILNTSLVKTSKEAFAIEVTVADNISKITISFDTKIIKETGKVVLIFSGKEYDGDSEAFNDCNFEALRLLYDIEIKMQLTKYDMLKILLKETR